MLEEIFQYIQECTCFVFAILYACDNAWTTTATFGTSQLVYRNDNWKSASVCGNVVTVAPSFPFMQQAPLNQNGGNFCTHTDVQCSMQGAQEVCLFVFAFSGSLSSEKHIFLALRVFRSEFPRKVFAKILLLMVFNGKRHRLCFEPCALEFYQKQSYIFWFWRLGAV